MLKNIFHFKFLIILIQTISIIVLCSSCESGYETEETEVEIIPDMVEISDITVGEIIDTLVLIKNNTDSQNKNDSLPGHVYIRPGSLL